MISYLITSFQEQKTIARAMEAVVNQKKRSDDWELLVCSPDEETMSAARHIKDQFQNLKIFIFQDEGKGKPSALNLLFQKARGDILILTDGDVWMDEYATEKLIEQLYSMPYSTPYPHPIGLVSGHPVPINERDALLGFWAHVLTSSADYKRKRHFLRGTYLDASGYLLAMKKEVIETALKQKELSSSIGITNEGVLPEHILVDDSYLSHLATQSGYSVAYASEAIVHVKFPTTFSDWMKQKIRSTGGYVQIQSLFPAHVQMRHFQQEVSEFFIPLKFVKSPKEFFWLLLLYAARLYLWLRIAIFYKLRKKFYASGWPRVESTK